MFKSGGIGVGTNNIALDKIPSGEIPLKPPALPPARLYAAPNLVGTRYPPTPRMKLLELLERDLLLLTLCEYCKTLHSPVWVGKNNARPCYTSRYYCNSHTGFVGSAEITLLLVRRAVSWSRQGRDGNSLLTIANSRILCPVVSHSTYRTVCTFQARVCGGSVIAQTQLFVARVAAARPSGLPTAHDLATLDNILAWTSQDWARSPAVHQYVNKNYKTRECLAKKDSAGRMHFHTPKCYREDVGPPRCVLDPRLRCMMAHKALCSTGRCRGKDWSPGRVDGSQTHFYDYSASAIPVPDPRNPWDRVLVFTSWRDLGSGTSRDDEKWITRPGGMWHEHRKRNGSRPGDAYEAFEGVAEGAPYVPELPRGVADLLFPPRLPGNLR